uniref:nascent polypeptide-associated complex subunit alpha, muscle-specific form-like isoform X2 n=1 Tax=Nyctereutes procyonoides TaxID=34880 RepID=UPI002444075F|nr:nascent polypeptide-associated complex subunit alpha, muscle-specific form-like isoform X2 [Nyctereutes procyonoides]
MQPPLFLALEIEAVGLSSPFEFPGRELAPARIPGPSRLSRSAGSPPNVASPGCAHGGRDYAAAPQRGSCSCARAPASTAGAANRIVPTLPLHPGPLNTRQRMPWPVCADADPCAGPAPPGAGTSRGAHARAARLRAGSHRVPPSARPSSAAELRAAEVVPWLRRTLPAWTRPPPAPVPAELPQGRGGHGKSKPGRYPGARVPGPLRGSPPSASPNAPDPETRPSLLVTSQTLRVGLRRDPQAGLQSPSSLSSLGSGPCSHTGHPLSLETEFRLRSCGPTGRRRNPANALRGLLPASAAASVKWRPTFPRPSRWLLRVGRRTDGLLGTLEGLAQPTPGAVCRSRPRGGAQTGRAPACPAVHPASPPGLGGGGEGPAPPAGRLLSTPARSSAPRCREAEHPSRPTVGPYYRAPQTPWRADPGLQGRGRAAEALVPAGAVYHLPTFTKKEKPSLKQSH